MTIAFDPFDPEARAEMVLGPTFGQEIIAAGLGGLQFGWNTDGTITGRENLTAAQNRTLDEVIAKHDPKRELLAERVISDRQFFQALALTGVITYDEALAAVKTGALPQDFQAMLQGMDPQTLFVTEMLLSGATQFERDHLLVEKFGQAFGWSSDQIDDLWRMAAAL